MDTTEGKLEQKSSDVQPAIEDTIQLGTEETFATVERRYFNNGIKTFNIKIKDLILSKILKNFK